MPENQTGWNSPKIQELPDQLTIRQLRDATGFSRETIRDWIDRYGIQPVNIPYGKHGAYHYSKSDILEGIGRIVGRGYHIGGTHHVNQDTRS